MLICLGVCAVSLSAVFSVCVCCIDLRNRHAPPYLRMMLYAATISHTSISITLYARAHTRFPVGSHSARPPPEPHR